MRQVNVIVALEDQLFSEVECVGFNEVIKRDDNVIWSGSSIDTYLESATPLTHIQKGRRIECYCLLRACELIDEGRDQ